MKRKVLGVLLVTAIMTAMPVLTFAARSGSGEDSGSEAEYNPWKDPTSVTVTDSGVKLTGATTSGSTNGSMIGVRVDTVTSKGEPITVNEKGEAVIGKTAVSFANGEASTAGLPKGVKDTINSINTGKPLSEVVSGVDLTGYHALTGTHAIITKEADTGSVAVGMVEVSLYVPNLLDNLEQVSVLFYNNATGRWEVLSILKKDIKAKTVTVDVPGSGTLSVIYKK